ncbi:putative tricarboxylic transport membrane protein [Prauserella shujinwangii]|uniref:Putative tricarboxylic transport membrane protein n=1 Tax=Prauserella shujinwangii TaxID=1453103 RepID=A0A2T0LZ48_9PSEU|nr:tripartite tricarboxylate transporter TctB family protein [Prauserella shujinwangii]PRX49384.1 putative tricarboxylic transport membrane protein [Prauserella shujinwangii]
MTTMNDTAPRSAARDPQGGRSADRAQYGVCAFLALVGIAVIVDTSLLDAVTTTNDPIGPRPVPMLLGALLIVVSVVYAIDVARGGTGEPEGGEDVDLTASMNWRTVLLLVAVFVANALLIDWLGWVISGSLLFWGSAIALGSRRYFLGLAIAITLSLITFYAFAIGLGVNLPAGVLRGIL